MLVLPYKHAFPSQLVIFHSGKSHRPESGFVHAEIKFCWLCWAVRVLFSWNSVTLPPPTKVTWLTVLVPGQCLQCFMSDRGIKCCCSFLAYIITTLLLRPIWNTACSRSLKCAMRRNNKYPITQSSYCVFRTTAWWLCFCTRSVSVSLSDVSIPRYMICD